MKIAILDDYQNAVADLDCFKILAGQDVLILDTTEKEEVLLSEKLKGVGILVLIRERTPINEHLLALLPDLKLISQTGKISNHLDLAACSKYKVAVAEGLGSPVAPAELCWALIMNTLRQIPEAIAGMKNGKWQVNIGTTIYGKTIGIWGYGKIGQRIAGYARAFGAQVLVWGSESSREKAEKDGFESALSKAEFFRKADVVSLHLRLSEITIGIVKEGDLGQMKPEAVLINTSRAELIEKGALLNALQRGRPGFAGIDVYEEEPVHHKDFEFLKMPNVVCTPHLGYVEKNGYELYFSKAFENVINYINGNPTNIANPESLEG
jgi:D-3-phosphoglycerate dehydrogenase